jgi:hypothetical protein
VQGKRASLSLPQRGVRKRAFTNDPPLPLPAAALPQASLESGLGLAAEQPRYDRTEQLARRALAVVERDRR